MKPEVSAQVFGRPKTALLQQLKIWKELRQAAHSIKGPLAELAFRTRSSTRAFVFSIAGTLVAVSLLLDASHNLRSLPAPPARTPTIKLATYLAPTPTPVPEPVAKPPAAPEAAKMPAPSQRKRRRSRKAPTRPNKRSTGTKSSAQTLDFSEQQAGTLESAGPAGSAGSSHTGQMASPGGSTAKPGSGSRRPNRAQPAKVASGAAWNCAWPDAALDRASQQERVLVQITLNQRGKVIHGKVLENPGFGFGKEALNCAKRQRYTPAKDAEGRAISGGTLKLRVNFQRSE